KRNYDEYFDSSKIMKSSTTNVETPIIDEVSKSFQEESSSSSLNDDVQQSPEELVTLNKKALIMIFAPVARIEDIRLFLAYAAHKDFTVYQMDVGLWYLKDSGFDLTAYSDADHAGCHLDRKSTSGSVQFLGDKLVCWSSKKQNCVSISTAESEYVAVSSCCGCVLN
nr:uncharacterized mitochondrial protein AtMg00810-like [Tanacetum cinerariifolium]